MAISVDEAPEIVTVVLEIDGERVEVPFTRVEHNQIAMEVVAMGLNPDAETIADYITAKALAAASKTLRGIGGVGGNA